MGSIERKIVVGWGLTLVIVIFIGAYWLNEPNRMTAAEEEFRLQAVERGHELYEQQCVSCHGETGAGIPNLAPALNSKMFLDMIDFQTIRDVTSEGLPNTLMPAFAEAEGGPLRQDQIDDLVAFIRNWEDTAPVLPTVAPAIEPASLYAQNCAGCHGPNGEGTDAVSVVLNSRGFLERTNDTLLYKLTAQGRPDQGMPAFANQLSKAQINALVDLMRGWEKTAPEVESSGETLYARYCAFCHGADGEGAENVPVILNSDEFLAGRDDADLRQIISGGHENMPPWSEAMTDAEIKSLIELIRGWGTGEAATETAEETVPAADGAALYAEQCAMCHGESGGKLGLILGDEDYLADNDDANFREKILEGVPDKMMPFADKLTSAEVEAIIAFMRQGPGAQ